MCQSKRGHQAEVVEHRRPEIEREIAHLLDQPLRNQAGAAEPVGRPGVRGRHLELQFQAGERLSDFVVQLARDPPPLRLLHVHQAHGDRFQPQPGLARPLEQTRVLQRHREPIGDPARQLRLGRRDVAGAAQVVDLQQSNRHTLRDERQRERAPGRVPVFAGRAVTEIEIGQRTRRDDRPAGIAARGKEPRFPLLEVVGNHRGPPAGQQIFDVPQHRGRDRLRLLEREDRAVGVGQRAQVSRLPQQRLFHALPLGDVLPDGDDTTTGAVAVGKRLDVPEQHGEPAVRTHHDVLEIRNRFAGGNPPEIRADLVAHRGREEHRVIDPEHVGAPPSEHTLGRRVELGDALLEIEAHDGRPRHLHDGPEPRFAFEKGIRRALARRDVDRRPDDLGGGGLARHPRRAREDPDDGAVGPPQADLADRQRRLLLELHEPLAAFAGVVVEVEDRPAAQLRRRRHAEHVRERVVAFEDDPGPRHAENTREVVVEQHTQGPVAAGPFPAAREPGGDLRVVWHTIPE